MNMKSSFVAGQNIQLFWRMYVQKWFLTSYHFFVLFLYLFIFCWLEFINGIQIYNTYFEESSLNCGFFLSLSLLYKNKRGKMVQETSLWKIGVNSKHNNKRGNLSHKVSMSEKVPLKFFGLLHLADH